MLAMQADINTPWASLSAKVVDIQLLAPRDRGWRKIEYIEVHRVKT